ncbi:hypothetical protein CBR_g39867 [Chara braunii]|uniref:Uncharacterized protein n=1 Tax=Chara braunii TaxID=69332 RepID=A0A388LSR2_CHABU|nr:hypothetical protein CBR_g39867 [Chara braunii]|eukprot:GBG85299.1 hypothetical protein CBR_g39867 [Chara braunii]
MDSAFALLSDVSLLISPTLAVVAPPEPAGRDDERRNRGFDEFGGDTILHPLESGTPAIFHVGAPWAVEQGLAEEVARNRRGGPPVAAQRGHGSHQLSDGVSSVRPPDEGVQREPHRGSTETLEARHPGVIHSDKGVAHDTAQPGSANAGWSMGGGIERIMSSTAHGVGGGVGGGGGGADAARSIGGGIEHIGSSTTHDVGGGGGGGRGGGGADAARSIGGGIECIRSSTAHDVGHAHVDEPRPHLMGMRDIMRPPLSRSPAADPVAHGQASQSALPTRSFYDGAAMDQWECDIGHASSCGPADVPTRSFYDGAAMDQRECDIRHASSCGPTDVPAGVRLIGNVDGTCHGSMRAYEEQHGRPIRAKTTDVHETRTATARLSRTRKKGIGASIPYHRRRPHPFFRNRDETGQMPAAANGRGRVDGGERVDESGRGEKRRGGTIIIHDDSSTAAEGGETTGADDPNDSDYVPRIRTAEVVP